MKPVKRRRLKKNRSPSALARSRKRHARFLEKKLAGKPDLASPEEDQQDLDNSVCRGVPEGKIKVRRGWVWEGVSPSHTLGKKIKI